MRCIALALIAGVGCATESRVRTSPRIDIDRGGRAIGVGLDVAASFYDTDCEVTVRDEVCDTALMPLDSIEADGVVLGSRLRTGGGWVTGLSEGRGTLTLRGALATSIAVDVQKVRFAALEWHGRREGFAVDGVGPLFAGSAIRLRQRHYVTTSDQLQAIAARHRWDVELNGRSPLSIDGGDTEAAIEQPEPEWPSFALQPALLHAGSSLGAARVSTESGAVLDVDVVDDSAIAEVRFFDASTWPRLSREVFEVRVASRLTVHAVPFDVEGRPIFGCSLPPTITTGPLATTVAESRHGLCAIDVDALGLEPGDAEIELAWGDARASLLVHF